MKNYLSATQRRVMKWLGHGWEAQQQHGATVFVNGQKLCNIDTLSALERAGLVEKSGQWTWRATEAGKDLTGKL